uniref:Uncharacterized protein n=1 Tax=Romanomermis culicivorax TaxID=13658 RepID=A0A915JP37_ROMCU
MSTVPENAENVKNTELIKMKDEHKQRQRKQELQYNMKQKFENMVMSFNIKKRVKLSPEKPILERNDQKWERPKRKEGNQENRRKNKKLSIQEYEIMEMIIDHDELIGICELIAYWNLRMDKLSSFLIQQAKHKDKSDTLTQNRSLELDIDDPSSKQADIKSFVGIFQKKWRHFILFFNFWVLTYYIPATK